MKTKQTLNSVLGFIAVCFSLILVLTGIPMAQAGVLQSTVLSIAPVEGVYGDSAVLIATLTPAIEGKTIIFKIQGVTVGTAITNTDGVAVYNHPSFLEIGNWPSGLAAYFPGDENYSASYAQNGFLMHHRVLTVNVTANDKPYDGTNVASGNCAFGNVLPADAPYVVCYLGYAYFPSKNVGNDMTVTSDNITFGGSRSCYYALPAPNMIQRATADIYPRPVTGSFTASDKTYDGSASAIVLSRSLDGVIGSEAVSLAGGAAAFSDSNSGSGKVVSLTGAYLFGVAAGNYRLDSVAPATADIVPAESFVSINCPQTPQTYVGSAITPCDAVVTGAGGLNKPVMVTYSNNLNVGTAYANASFAGDNNHNGSSGSASFIIAKANAECIVNGYSDKYDGNSHGASGSCTGIVGETLAGLDLGQTMHNTVGTYSDTWLFVDPAGNYASQSGIITNKILPSYTISGFYQPVDMNGVYNLIKGGNTVPLKFEVFNGVTELADTGVIKSLVYTQTACSAGIITDEIETLTTGVTSLRYDSGEGQFIYNWKTPESSGLCYRVTLSTQDDSSIVAYFKTK